MTGRMGKSRNIFLVWLVWPLITLGIYHFVWWFKINQEAHDLDRDIEVRPGVSVIAITLGVFIIVPPFVSIYRTGERIARMQQAAGMTPSCTGALGLLASFFCSLHVLYYQNELNKIWATLGGTAEGTVITLPGYGAPGSPAAGPARAA